MFTIFYGSDKYTISSHGNCLSQPVLPTDQAAAQVAEEVATANGLPIGTIPQLFSWKWFKNCTGNMWRFPTSWGSPKSSILTEFSLTNHPAIGVPPFMETLRFSNWCEQISCFDLWLLNLSLKTESSNCRIASKHLMSPSSNFRFQGFRFNKFGL